MTLADAIEALGALCLVIAAALAVGAAGGWAMAGVVLVAKSFELELRGRRTPRRRSIPDGLTPDSQVRG